MQDQPSDAGADRASGDAEDIRDQGVVLIHVLTRHPTLLMVPKLVREITSGSEDFGEGDAVERAIRDLTGYGLLHLPRRDRHALSGGPAVPEDHLRGELLRRAGGFRRVGASRRDRAGFCGRIAPPGCSGPPESPRLQDPTKQRKARAARSQRSTLPCLSPRSSQELLPEHEVPPASTSASSPAPTSTARHTMNRTGVRFSYLPRGHRRVSC